MINSAVYNKNEARTLLYNYSKNHEFEFQKNIRLASLRIETTLSTLDSFFEQPSDLGNFDLPFWRRDYDFTTHDFAEGNGEASPVVSGNMLLRAKIIRDYMVEQTRILGIKCSDPSIPHAAEFTTTYLQAKLLRDSGCSNIQEYIEKDNLIHHGTRLKSFLLTVPNHFQTRIEKQHAKAVLVQQSMTQLRLQANSLPPLEALRAMMAVPVLPSTPVTDDTHEPFKEISFNGKKFAFFGKPITEDQVIIDMPNHSVFFFDPIQAKTLCKIHAEAIFIWNSIKSDIPGRCFIKAEDEAVVMAHESPYSFAFSLQARPVRIFDSETAVIYNKGLTAIMKKVLKADKISPPDALECLKATAKFVILNIPYEQVVQKFNLPAEITQDKFLNGLELNILPLLKYHNVVKP